MTVDQQMDPIPDAPSGSTPPPQQFGRGRITVAVFAVAVFCYACRSITVQIRDHQSGKRILGGDGSAPFGKASQATAKVVELDGKTLLWAGKDQESGKALWFDITDSLLDWRGFQYGIGKDTIPAIDKGLFLPADDTRLAKYGWDEHTSVLGYAHDGEARAYPIALLTAHELVNDTVGGKPVTVGW